MDTFNLVLKNDKLSQYDRTAWFIILINFVLFIYVGVSSQERGTRAVFMISAALILICALINYFLHRVKHNQGSPYIYAAFFVCFLTWLQQAIVWAPIICFILSVLYQLAKRPLTVRLSPGEIIYTSVFQRKITWDQLSNVILKDGLLTIDFRNNRIIQSEIINFPPVNEKKFNEFCREQLNKRKPHSPGGEDYDGFTELLHVVD